ncbi:MAG: hypothetical protein ACOC2O_00975, partial [Bacillota bacterium]
MDEDKKLTVFFAKPDQYFDFEMDVGSYTGAEGKVDDLSDNAPYPPGYEVQLKAEPETQQDTFSHWEVEIEVENEDGDIEKREVDPTDYFADYESAWTTFEVPGEKPFEFETQYFSGIDKIINVVVKAVFAKMAPGDIDYNHKDFYEFKSGGYGYEIKEWDVSYVEEGEEIDFHFDPYRIPDRFKLYYGGEEIFNSDWSSGSPDSFKSDPNYPPSKIKRPTDKSGVKSSDICGGGHLTFEKKEEHDWVRVVIENRDSGTAWEYTLGAEPDVQFSLFAEYSDGELQEISEEELTDESENPEVEIKPTSDDGGPEMPDFVLVAAGPGDYDLGVNNLNISFDKIWETEVWDPDKEEMVTKKFNMRHSEDFSWKKIGEENYPDEIDDKDEVRAWGIEAQDLCGGKVNFNVNINNFTQEFAFEMKGENAEEETVLDYTGEKASDDLWYAEAIASHESIGGRQFVDEDTPDYVMLNEKGVPLVGFPDGWGIMQLEGGARRGAEGNYRELAWNWQKNVDGGINWME